MDECYPNGFTLFSLRSGPDWNKSEYRNTNPDSPSPDDETIFSKIALNVAVCTKIKCSKVWYNHTAMITSRLGFYQHLSGIDWYVYLESYKSGLLSLWLSGYWLIHTARYPDRDWYGGRHWYNRKPWILVPISTIASISTCYCTCYLVSVPFRSRSRAVWTYHNTGRMSCQELVFSFVLMSWDGGHTPTTLKIQIHTTLSDTGNHRG